MICQQRLSPRRCMGVEMIPGFVSLLFVSDDPWGHGCMEPWETERSAWQLAVKPND